MAAPRQTTYFEQQRAMLVQDIAVNLEHVLQNMNKLNRSLEGVIAVGNEFGQVEGLWSQFENVMAQQPGQTQTQTQQQQQQQQQTPTQTQQGQQQQQENVEE